MASRSINRMVLLGHLGGDAETRFTPNGVARTVFSIATNRVWKDQNGEQKEETDWHNVVLWRSENLAAYLTKGKQVYVEGRLSTRSYDKDGERRYVTEVIAEDVILLGGGNGGTKDNNPSTPQSSSQQRGAGGRSAAPGNSRSGNAGRGSAAQRQAPSPPDDPGITDDDVPFD